MLALAGAIRDAAQGDTGPQGLSGRGPAGALGGWLREHGPAGWARGGELWARCALCGALARGAPPPVRAALMRLLESGLSQSGDAAAGPAGPVPLVWLVHRLRGAARGAPGGGAWQPEEAAALEALRGAAARRAAVLWSGEADGGALEDLEEWEGGDGVWEEPGGRG